jgi:hypothetical protein
VRKRANRKRTKQTVSYAVLVCHTLHCTSPLVSRMNSQRCSHECTPSLLGKCLIRLVRIIAKLCTRYNCIVAVSSTAEIQVVVIHHVQVVEPRVAPCRRRPWLLFAWCESAVVCRRRAVSKRCVAIGSSDGKFVFVSFVPCV